MDPELKRLIVGVALLGLSYLCKMSADKQEDDIMQQLSFVGFIISGVVGMLFMIAVTARWVELV